MFNWKDMKKLILTLASIALAAGLGMAQDLATATETFNNAAASVNAGDKAGALGYFKSALTMAEALGEDGAEIVANCKKYIPDLMLSMAKDAIKAGEYTSAVSQLKEVAEVAAKYEDAGAVEDATKLIPIVYIQQGSQALKAKDAKGAADAFKEALAIDPTNANAALRLGSALSSLGDTDGAIAAFETAAANGQQTAAYKQISTILLKSASSALKAKDYNAAIESANKSLGYNESANAYKIAGTAYNALGNKADAIKSLGKYLELSPNAADAAQIKTAIENLKK